ncbi:MAG: DUF58 domain-containing protein [Defluviicoccus sp.]
MAASPAGRTLLEAEALIQNLPPLLVAAERVAATVAQGVHGRRRVGSGESFWQFRRYQAGDSAARIDWRQSAKTDRLYVRETEWAAAQSVWLWCDGSASMRYRSATAWPSKIDSARLLLLALASLLIRSGERITLLGDGFQPAAGRAALARLALALDARQAVPAQGFSAPNPSAPKSTLASLPPAEPLPRYARLVLFGDFLAPLERIEAAVHARVRSGVRGALVQIVDPAEEALPFSGRVLLAGCEADGEALFGRVEAARAAYRTRFAAHREALRTLARGAGWTHLVHRIDQPPQMALLALYLALAEGTQRMGRPC